MCLQNCAKSREYECKHTDNILMGRQAATLGFWFDELFSNLSQLNSRNVFV
jgi:hypothetical protein